MSFTERDAIKFRIEQIAGEKKELRKRDRELDEEYTSYIERLRDLDVFSEGKGGPLPFVKEEKTRNFEEQPLNTISEKEPNDFKKYDFDALKKGLTGFKKPDNDFPEFSTKPDNVRGSGSQYDLTKAAEAAERILKESGDPMRINILKEFLAEEGYKWNHFSSTLPNIMRHSKHIIKPFRGHVEYVTDASNHPKSQQNNTNVNKQQTKKEREFQH